MELDDFAQLIERALAPIGFCAEDGEEFRSPKLEVLRYWQKAIRLSPLPILGRGRAVVALASEPNDASLPNAADALLRRLASAAHSRFPPWPSGPGLTLGLTAILVVERPIEPGHEALLDRVLTTFRPGRSRVVHLGLFMVNLEQGAMAQSFALSMPDLFPEPFALAETLTNHYGRFLGILPDQP